MKTRIAAAMLAAGCSALPALSQEVEPKANPAAQLETPTVEVVGTTPLPGIGTPVSEVPANVQAVTGAQMQKQESISLPDYLDRNLGSVSVNESQGNPFQPDVNFRGFTASPLLGFPQGLSVFQDGVRVNEPFGDVVNWDLIPQGAISSMTLIPGSNPVFGLNTLGGALSVNTKSGREYPGGSVALFGGSFATYSGNFEYGGVKDNFDYYVYGNYYNSDGWRDHSSSVVQQVFGKVGYQTADFDADLSYSFADNNLFGAQTIPAAMYSANDKIAYTWPDITNNNLNFVNLRLSKVLSEDKILAGNVYWRELQSSNTSSNVNGEFDGGNSGTVCDGTTPDTLCPASNLQSLTDTTGAGGTIQFTLLKPLVSHKNSFTLGASYDYGNTVFTQSEQNAVFNSARDTVGVGPYVLFTDVNSTNAYSGFFFTDTFAFTDQLLMTLAGRYNIATIRLTDELGTTPSINGTNTYQRFNPAVGLNYNPSKAINTYVSYNEGMRAPTPVELTCADPSAPCQLPNAFVSDPPLQAVIAKTLELGGRGMLSTNTAWTAAVYQANLSNDIQFVSSGASGTVGYFTNIPQTRRQGVELGVQQRLGAVNLQAAYGYVNATYQSSFFIFSPNNSSANSAGDISVQPGDHVPGIPRNNFKLRADWQASSRISIGGTIVYASSQYAVGDNNNQDANGPIPAYTIFNLDGRWQITDQLQVFGRINNVFDRKYQTAGVLGENFFTGPNFSYNPAGVQPTVFSSPGAPFGIWVGVRYDFGRPTKPAGQTESN
ncbi:MAG TPA: TonB-dependent receptor [Burkholderiales bacterium]|nr:TonB-dependent receptor [Burkholderiales bacterium]